MEFIIKLFTGKSLLGTLSVRREGIYCAFQTCRAGKQKKKKKSFVEDLKSDTVVVGIVPLPISFYFCQRYKTHKVRPHQLATLCRAVFMNHPISIDWDQRSPQEFFSRTLKIQLLRPDTRSHWKTHTPPTC